ncbi:transcriptional regulator with only HTH domain, AraC family [Actinobacteria bacterium OK074]|nr:transcriptional regulator with only HTH domain, AraC family [Actinobacteria bacterium OK074]
MTMSNENLPAEDRFEWWREQMARDSVPTMASSPYADDFRATATMAELGPVRLSLLTFPEVRALRTPALVRRSDPELYGLNLITSNALWIAQCDQDARFGRGDLMLYDSSQPFDSRAVPRAGHEGMLMLHIPKAALPLRPERLNRLLACRLPGDTGMNTVLVHYLRGLASVVARGDVGEAETQRLGEVALALAAATLAGQIDAEDRLAPETRRQALLSRIETFVELNLGDPELTPAVIAAHHHISVGYLHRLFQHRELTLTAWIRHRRLECARADLTDPRLRLRPVHAVGARWGFRHPADFSRAFRAAHGLPPVDYRRAALAAGGGAARQERQGRQRRQERQASDGRVDAGTRSG